MSYQEAAKLIARHHPGTRVVIMGHTHAGLSASALPVFGALANAKQFRLNSNVIRCAGAGDTLEIAYFEQAASVF